jgi:hypothetical protein
MVGKRCDTLPSHRLSLRWPWFLKQRNCGDLRVCSQLSALKGVEGHVEAPGWD